MTQLVTATAFQRRDAQTQSAQVVEMNSHSRRSGMLRAQQVFIGAAINAQKSLRPPRLCVSALNAVNAGCRGGA